jgi:hypothetical protein
MKYKPTSEYRAEYQALRLEYSKLDVVRDALQVTLAKKLRLLCTKHPEAPVTNIIFDKPKRSDYFPAMMLTKKPRRWNPNFYYAMGYASNTLLDYIDQIEKYAEKL